MILLQQLTVNTITKRKLQLGVPVIMSVITGLKKVDEQHFIIAHENAELIGFSSVTNKGYLDFMFVHAQRQGQGIALMLLVEIERIAANLKLNLIITHASITARPFFEKCGLKLVKQQTVEVRGIELTNFVMNKELKIQTLA